MQARSSSISMTPPVLPFEQQQQQQLNAVRKPSLTNTTTSITTNSVDNQERELTSRQKTMLIKYTELKLRRNLQQIEQLKKILAQDRIYASSRSLNIIEFTQNHTDYLIQPLWGNSSNLENPFKKQMARIQPNSRGNKGSANASNECCVIM